MAHMCRVTLLCQGRAKAHAGLGQREVACREHNSSLVIIGPMCMSAPVKRVLTAPAPVERVRAWGGGEQPPGKNPDCRSLSPQTRDGHAATYSTMREHVCYNCTTCFTQVKSGGLTRMHYTPPAKARRPVLGTTELARNAWFCTRKALGRLQLRQKGRGVKRRKAKESL